MFYFFCKLNKNDSAHQSLHYQKLCRREDRCDNAQFDRNYLLHIILKRLKNDFALNRSFKIC